MRLQLLAPAGDVRAQKALVTAAFAGVAVETPKFNVGVDDKKTAFLEKSPLGRLPVLDTPEGSIFESNAIARYLARIRPDLGLHGSTFTESAQVDMWMDFATYELEVPICCLVQSAKAGKAPPERALSDVENAVKVLDKHLQTRTFVVGERLTVADICLAVIITHGVNSGNIANLLHTKYRNSCRWFKTITQQPLFIKHVGNVKCFVGADGAASASSKTAPAAAAKAAKPSSSSSSSGADHDGDDAPSPPPKKENPLDLLPPSKMDLNEWKRCYSNSKDLYGKAMPWFWEKFDKDAWSFWYMKYQKLEGECTVNFVTSNQLGGFLQRIETKFRNYSFGVFDVVGTTGDFDIQGVWMVRGHEIPFELTDHVSFDVHSWKKLDHTKPEDKKLIEDYWCADEEVEGRPVADSKVWK